MLVETSTECDLIILQDVNCRNFQDRSEIHSFMKGGCCRRAVTDPCQSLFSFATLFESQRDTCDDGSESRHLTCRSNNAMRKAADVEILSVARRIRGREVFPEHVGDGYSHLVACARIADHRPDLVNG